MKIILRLMEKTLREIRWRLASVYAWFTIGVGLTLGYKATMWVLRKILYYGGWDG